MTQLNIEIKAKSNNQDFVREVLKSLNAKFIGVDNQLDTYFKASSGRLKLRKEISRTLWSIMIAKISRVLKRSNVTFYKSVDKSSLKEILTKALGILIAVDKTREIYFIENVKFHLDDVKNLGSFVEIEAIDSDGKIGKDKLLEQCNFYLNLFKIKQEDLISNSYSDLLLKK